MGKQLKIHDVMGYLLRTEDMIAIRSLLGRSLSLSDVHDHTRLQRLGLVNCEAGWGEKGEWRTGSPRLTPEGRRVATEVLKIKLEVA